MYLSYYSIMYESPVIFNRSRAVYVNSLYALDNNGTLLWKQPMDGYVTHAVARNDTFFYSTNGGRIGGNTVNVAAGIALIAAAYVFLRFFIIGTVARARTKIESNRNRNDLLKFINENPGVTAVDISRGLEMNLGTIRYHLFILSANHKIVPYKDDGKFLRYFRNSGAYSREERSWLSLMRREPIRKVIACAGTQPGAVPAGAGPGTRACHRRPSITMSASYRPGALSTGRRATNGVLCIPSKRSTTLTSRRQWKGCRF